MDTYFTLVQRFNLARGHNAEDVAERGDVLVRMVDLFRTGQATEADLARRFLQRTLDCSIGVDGDGHVAFAYNNRSNGQSQQ